MEHGMAGVLQKSFVDVLLSVGLDDKLGFVQVHGSSYDVSCVDDLPVVGCAYQPQVLSVCTCHGDLSDVTLHQNEADKTEDPNTLSQSKASIKQGQLGSLPQSKNKLFKRKTARYSSFRSTDIRNRSSKKTNTSTTVPDLPISPDVINSLPAFCFPDNALVYSESQEDYCHYLVLTDITGLRSYVSCLTFWIPYQFTRIKDGSGSTEWQCSAHTSGSQGHSSSSATHTNLKQKDRILYLPLCCVLVSKQPYFSVMKEALSLVVSKIKKDPEEMKSFLSDMALQLTCTVAPPCGSLGISFNLDGIQLMLPPGGLHGHPVVDLPLNLIFLSFPVDQVLRLLSAVMTQQRVVFLSAEYSLLTVISQIILTFLLPFRWLLTYVPVLPSKLLELIDAPGSFIMGCHSKHRSLVNQVQGLVIADVDQGEVRICSTLDVPHIPEFAVLPFKQSFSKLQLHYDMATLSSPPSFSYEEMRGNKQAFQQKFNSDIQTAFLELCVNLFRDTLGYIKSERMFFNKEAFLECQPPEDLPFYTQVLESDLFGKFLRDRLSQKMDQWAIFEEKTRPKIRNSFGSPEDHHKMIRPLSRARRDSSYLSLSEYVTELQQNTVRYIQLPFFSVDEVDQYMEKCLLEFRAYLLTCKNVQHQASCHFMCGMLSLACGSLISCLEHFHHLSSTHSTLFPVRLATELIHKMTDMEKDVLRSTEFFKKSEILKTLLNKENSPIYRPIIMELDKIPQNDVDLDGFMEYVQILEISADHDTTVRLFEALTLGRKPVLDPTTFEVFYECWKEIEQECASKLPALEGFLDRYECVLKASVMTKTDFGMGRIVLTQKRLLFLQDGSRKCKEIIKLREISKIEKIQQTIFLKKVRSLKIYNVNAKNNKSGFVVCLRESRNCWYMVIQEMWVGKYIAEELRDLGIIQQAAHNVLLIDALMRSGDEECTAHHSCVEQAANHLCFFTSRKDQHKLTPETKDVLQHRVNPNIGEGARSTVEALLYTPGNRSSSDEDIGPKLWCGMGTGKILIYDASTWLLDRQFIHAADRVVCLVAVGLDSVWAGSFDKAVYIIDIHTKSSNQTLREHTDMISDLAVSYDASTVYSASLNGQIIAWDAQTLKHRQLRHLVGVHSLKSIKCVGSELWCCTRDEVLVFNTEGTMMRRLQHADTDHKTVQMDTFLLTKHSQVWLGGSRMGEVIIYDAESLEKIRSVKVKCRGISKMVSVQDRVWAGSKGGMIYIFNSVTHKLEKTLKAHTDAIRSMCLAENRYVMTGAGSADGKVAIWRTSS